MNNIEQISQERLVLLNNKTHVYLIKLDLFDSKECIKYLSDDEQIRARNFKIVEKKDQFIITRSILRILLSIAMSKSYEKINIFYEESGKPSVKDLLNGKPIGFNVSHSGNYALIAVSLSNKVGVDIELMDLHVDYKKLSKRFFSEQEYDELQKVHYDNQRDIFYRIWTQKESFVKATGHGIKFGLKNFSIILDSDCEVGVRVVTSAPVKDSWFTYNIFELDRYKTALTISTKDSDIILHQ